MQFDIHTLLHAWLKYFVQWPDGKRGGGRSIGEVKGGGQEKHTIRLTLLVAYLESLSFGVSDHYDTNCPATGAHYSNYLLLN